LVTAQLLARVVPFNGRRMPQRNTAPLVPSMNKRPGSNRRLGLSAATVFLCALILSVVITTLGIHAIFSRPDRLQAANPEGALLRVLEVPRKRDGDTAVTIGTGDGASELSKRPPSSERAPVWTEADRRATFPLPTAIAGTNARVLLKALIGTHRPERDAVIAFAEGYDLRVYVLFVESLRRTGYDGDVVLSVSSPDKLAPGVEDYLRSRAGEGLVAYSVDWDCYEKSGEKLKRRGTTTTNNGFSDCKIHGMYADVYGNSIDDPREARPVATARFELYWAFCLNYSPKSRILLVDVRDTYFQLNPFSGIPRTSPSSPDGFLYLFEENAYPTSAAPNIGGSAYNSRWIRRAYGNDALKSVANKTVICSGSTIGDQVAIETYLRAMVKQFDDTKCKMVGCDQGLHNFVYYSGAISDVSGIRDIIVAQQGKGVVNNLAALRNSPLRDQGVLQNGTDLVLNWDGSVSAVAHQFDRDKELKGIMKHRTDKLLSELKF